MEQQNKKPINFAVNPFMQLLGIKIDEMTMDRGILSMEMKEEYTNPYGMSHGGTLFTLSDCCAGYTARADGRSYVTLDAQTHFLRGGKSTDRLIAESKVIRRGGKTCVVGVTVRNEDGDELTYSTFTMYCVD